MGRRHHLCVRGELHLRKKIEEVVGRLRTLGTIKFERFFDACASKSDLVITFLALLELARIDRVQILRESPGLIHINSIFGRRSSWNKLI